MHIKSLRPRSHRSLKVDENVPPAAVARLRKIETFDRLRAAGWCWTRWWRTAIRPRCAKGRGEASQTARDGQFPASLITLALIVDALYAG